MKGERAAGRRLVVLAGFPIHPCPRDVESQGPLLIISIKNSSPLGPQMLLALFFPHFFRHSSHVEQ